MKLKHSLRGWQTEALSKWATAGRRGIVEVATGGGKTLYGHACILDFLKHFPGAQIAIVVPTSVLLDQWYASLVDELGCDPAAIGLHGAGNRGKVAQINVMVANTARTRLPRLLAAEPTFLIVDECHRLGTPENARALTGPTVASLGLSATAERDYDDALAELVVPALGPIIYRYSLKDARRDGLTTPFDLLNVEVPLLEDEARKYHALTRRLLKQLGGATIGSLKNLPDEAATLLRRRARIAANATLRVPVAVRLVEENRGRRCIVFHEEIAAAERIAENLAQRGHAVTRYHSGISPAFRRANLLGFRRGMYRAIVSCRALDEGVNIPEVQVAVIASSSATVRQRVQRLGRVLRPSPGKERAVVYTLYSTATERRRLATEQEQLEDVASVTWIRASY